MLFKGAVSFKAQLCFNFQNLKVVLGTTPASALCQFLGCYAPAFLFLECFLISCCIVTSTEKQPAKQIFSPGKTVKFNNGKLLSALRKLTFNISKLLL